MTKQVTCANCGKLFTPWRQKSYCSERCRKRAENARLGGMKPLPATPLPGSEKLENLSQQNQRLAHPFRGDEGFEWTACNEVTQKLTRSSPAAVGWTMRMGSHWYGRIGKDFAFGPTTLLRARQVVEARLMGQDFKKLEDEKSWSGDCWNLIHPAQQ